MTSEYLYEQLHCIVNCLYCNLTYLMKSVFCIWHVSKLKIVILYCSSIIVYLNDAIILKKTPETSENSLSLCLYI